MITMFNGLQRHWHSSAFGLEERKGKKPLAGIIESVQTPEEQQSVSNPRRCDWHHVSTKRAKRREPGCLNRIILFGMSCWMLIDKRKHSMHHVTCPHNGSHAKVIFLKNTCTVTIPASHQISNPQATGLRPQAANRSTKEYLVCETLRVGFDYHNSFWGETWRVWVFYYYKTSS